MILVRFNKAWVTLFVALVVCGRGAGGLRAETPLPLELVIQKALARAQQAGAGAGQPGYTYTKLSVIEELDAAGKVREHKEKVYQVSFRAGSSQVRLLEVNGHPPRPADLKQPRQNEPNLRQLLGQCVSGDIRENLLTPELVARFDFRLLGRTVLNGRAAYQVAFQPKSPAPPVRHLVDRLLNRLSGTLWIDAEEFEVARADVRLGSEVDLLGGFLGSLRKLAFTMTRTRVADGVWLNSYSSGDFEGRKLLDSLRIKTKSQASNFHPLAVLGPGPRPTATESGRPSAS